MREERSIESNRVVIEGDLIIVFAHGQLTEKFMTELLALFTDVITAEGRIFIISMSDKTLVVPAEARRMVVEWSRTHHIAGAALVNSWSAASRALAALLISAINLSAKKRLNIQLCTRFDEAQAYVKKERTRLFGT